MSELAEIGREIAGREDAGPLGPISALPRVHITAAKNPAPSANAGYRFWRAMVCPRYGDHGRFVLFFWQAPGENQQAAWMRLRKWLRESVR